MCPAVPFSSPDPARALAALCREHLARARDHVVGICPQPTSDQSSNTVSVVDLADDKTLGVIPLGAPSPANFSPLYKAQVLVHGMGFSPHHRTVDVVSIGSNSVAFIDTATNTVKHITCVGRARPEAFWMPDGKEVWVTEQ